MASDRAQRSGGRVSRPANGHGRPRRSVAQSGGDRREEEPHRGNPLPRRREPPRNGRGAQRFGGNRSSRLETGQGLASAPSQQKSRLMNTERWHKIEQLYHDARTREPADRDRFLQGACTDDDARREVESLLARDSQ